MKNQKELTSALLKAYNRIFSFKEQQPKWAVHKRNSPTELVRPTIPFIGTRYTKQEKKILVYASAENLADYWKRKGDDSYKYWPGDWLDDDALAENRHRHCFDNAQMQQGRKLPFVHCSPMQDGGLLTAVMYLASKIRDEHIEEPKDFYETIAFGNFGKFSIETELQRETRTNPWLNRGEQLVLKNKEKKNVDYAGKREYLKHSFDYIQADIDTLKPDYIIMPNVDDGGFVDTVKGKAKVIRIYQIQPMVVHNMGENGRNNPQNAYKAREVEALPKAVQNTYHKIRGLNLQKYRYVFDYLDKQFQTACEE